MCRIERVEEIFTGTPDIAALTVIYEHQDEEVVCQPQTQQMKIARHEQKHTRYHH